MEYEQLTKLIKNVVEITNQKNIMLFGSQVLYSKFKTIENENILKSYEADFTLYKYKNRQELEDFVDLVDGSIGELSLYHNTNGFYAEGVSNFNDSFPKNYKNRLMNFQYSNNPNDIVQFMNIKDVSIMKLRRMSPKDHAFLEFCIENDLFKLEDIEEIIDNEYNQLWEFSKNELKEKIRIKFDFILNKNLNLIENEFSI